MMCYLCTSEAVTIGPLLSFTALHGRTFAFEIREYQFYACVYGQL